LILYPMEENCLNEHFSLKQQLPTFKILYLSVLYTSLRWWWMSLMLYIYFGDKDVYVTHEYELNDVTIDLDEKWQILEMILLEYILQCWVLKSTNEKRYFGFIDILNNVN